MHVKQFAVSCFKTEVANEQFLYIFLGFFENLKKIVLLFNKYTNRI